MADRRASNLAVGSMVSLALAVVAVAVMAVGGESRLFANKTPYVLTFRSVEGLVVGSPAKMAGVVVGTVTDIRLSTDPGHPGIRVAVGVDRAFAPRVRQDSRGALRILQLLSGEKFVEITPGAATSPQLDPGGEILVEQPQELLEQAAVTAENLNEITVSLRNILGALERGEGLIGKMIHDPTFGQQGVEALSRTVDNLEFLTTRLRAGDGFVGRLLTDDAFAERIDDLGAAMGNVADVLQSMRKDEGALGALTAEGGAGEQAIERLRDAADGLVRLTARLESPDSLVGRMLNDPEYARRITGDLARITANTAEIVEKINRGDGTLGALVNERTLHTGLENVVAGVNDSSFARWLIRRYRKKGIVLEEEPEAPADAPSEPEPEPAEPPAGP
jgi:phospholipid/cholesterol/gamma-HCH transport system substrate-binding protein